MKSQIGCLCFKIDNCKNKDACVFFLINKQLNSCTLGGKGNIHIQTNVAIHF